MRTEPNTSSKLYVADFGAPVEILDGSSYQHIGEISNGVDKPGGEWVDAQGRFYVASYGAKHVTEYSRTGGSPICTYSSGLSDPTNVTTDAAGNVYVVDYNFGSAGAVDVYLQCTNTIASQYAISGGPEGAALDNNGDLFVSYNAAGQGAIEEFPTGSKSPVPLSIPVAFSGGVIVDAKQNLLVCDQLQGLIDQVPPPYNSVTLQFTGFASPFNVSLSGNGKRLFLSDPARQAVVVLSYPAGVRLAVLKRKNGLRDPVGVAASPDFVQ